MTGHRETPASRSALRLLAYVAALGLVALVAGLALGIWTYDKRFIYDDRRAVWDVLSWIGALLAGIGVVALLVSLVGFAVVALVRAYRALRRSE